MNKPKLTAPLALAALTLAALGVAWAAAPTPQRSAPAACCVPTPDGGPEACCPGGPSACCPER